MMIDIPDFTAAAIDLATAALILAGGYTGAAMLIDHAHDAISDRCYNLLKTKKPEE